MGIRRMGQTETHLPQRIHFGSLTLLSHFQSVQERRLCPTTGTFISKMGFYHGAAKQNFHGVVFKPACSSMSFETGYSDSEIFRLGNSGSETVTTRSAGMPCSMALYRQSRIYIENNAAHIRGKSSGRNPACYRWKSCFSAPGDNGFSAP